MPLTRIRRAVGGRQRRRCAPSGTPAWARAGRGSWLFRVLWTACLLAGLASATRPPASTGQPVDGAGGAEIADPAGPADGTDDVADAAPAGPVDGAAATPPGGPVHHIAIHGVIDLGLAPFVSRVLAEVDSTATVLLDIDTFGGRVDAAVQVRDALLEADAYSIAFVHPRAISAGALISLACNTIAVAPGASIGAATPVTGGGAAGKMEAADEKVISYFRAEMRATAERRGRRGDIAEAMVDPDIEIEGVIEKGKLLTLTTSSALELGIADLEAANVDALLDALGLGDAPVIEQHINWAERAARVISHPVLSSFLLSIGFLGILIELYQPGWGIPGTVGIVCLLLFFLGHYIVDLAGFEEFALFAVGIVLLALEFFVIPGFGIAGIAGSVAILASVTLALIGLEWRVSWELGYVNRAMMVVSSSILGLVLGGFLFLRLVPRSRVARPFVLDRGLGREAGYTSHETALEKRLPAGTVGVALSDLRPSGKIRADGVRLDVTSEGGYIERGTRVVIRAWRAGTAVVAPAPPATLDTDGPPAGPAAPGASPTGAGR